MMPELVKLRERFKKDLEIVSWHVGGGAPGDIERVVQKQKLPYPVVVSPGWDEYQAWGNENGLPRAAVVDRMGRVRYTDIPPPKAEDLAVELLRQ